MDLGLSGKKVIMNGGAHGLGLASLKHFAAEGADVAGGPKPTVAQRFYHVPASNTAVGHLILENPR